MNNTFDRLIDGMCATLRAEVLTRLDDEFARGQVFGVINILNTFKVRADWSSGFLLQQIEAQQGALTRIRELLRDLPAGDTVPTLSLHALPAAVSIDDLLSLRDVGNRQIGEVLAWLSEADRSLAPAMAAQAEQVLREAMRAEINIELKNSPRPLFAEMSSGQEG